MGFYGFLWELFLLFPPKVFFPTISPGFAADAGAARVSQRRSGSHGHGQPAIPGFSVPLGKDGIFGSQHYVFL